MALAKKQIRRRGRPPKDQQGASETRQSLIRSGIEILTEKGFSSTGIDEILRRVDVPKGSFYHYFGSKDKFGAELIEHYSSFFKHKLDLFLLDETRTPIERLDAFVDDAIAGMEKYEFKRGCLVGNLGQEMGALPESFREQLIAVFNDWQLKVTTVLEAAALAGEINPQTNCQQAAYIFWIGWEGAVLRAKLEKSPAPLRSFYTFYISNLQ